MKYLFPWLVVLCLLCTYSNPITLSCSGFKRNYTHFVKAYCNQNTFEIFLFIHVPCCSSLHFPVHVFMYSNVSEYIKCAKRDKSGWVKWFPLNDGSNYFAVNCINQAFLITLYKIFLSFYSCFSFCHPPTQKLGHTWKLSYPPHKF